MAITTTESVKRKSSDITLDPSKWSKEWLETGLVNYYIDTEGDDEPIPVCLNGETVLIPVGREVEIPRCIAEILKQSHRIMEEVKKNKKEFENGKKKIDN